MCKRSCLYVLLKVLVSELKMKLITSYLKNKKKRFFGQDNLTISFLLQVFNIDHMLYFSYHKFSDIQFTLEMELKKSIIFLCIFIKCDNLIPL